MVTTAVVLSSQYNPYFNHAIEEILFYQYPQFNRILFLWVSEPTVVFGRHQNPWKEIYVDVAHERSIPIIRRLSGGGTVYHDKGNLNFSFIEHQSLYDESMHFDLIIDTCRRLGVQLACNQRKDICLDGYKVSGNAFYFRGDRKLHHGTLLINTKKSALWSVLRKEAPEIKAKGIPSVPSQVTSLDQYQETIDVNSVIMTLQSTLREKYTGDIKVLDAQTIQNEHPDLYTSTVNRLMSWSWTFGETPTFIYKPGGFDEIVVENGVISNCQDAKMIGKSFDSVYK